MSVTTNCRVAGASRQLNGASENPGSWTISASDDWTAWTIAIQPRVGMGFPVDSARSSTDGTVATTSPVINVPSGSTSFALLFCVVRNAAGGTISWPAGWSEWTESSADASDDTTAVGWRIPDGSEGSTITLTFDTSGKFAAIMWRLTNVDTGGAWLLVGANATGTSTVPDPPSQSAPWGVMDTLWLWAGGWEGLQTSPPASNPTSYSNPFGASTGTDGQTILPDADTAEGGWTTAPLFSKVNDSSDATIITATAS